MKKYRVFIILGTSFLAFLVITLVLASAAVAAPYTGPESGIDVVNLFPSPPVTRTIDITILNTDTTSFYNGGVPAYYDSNGSTMDYFGAMWVGADICASGSLPNGVRVELFDENDNTFPVYNSTLADSAVNTYTLGLNESGIRDLPPMEDGDCNLAYFYVYTPRDWKGACDITEPYPSGCGTRPFQIHAYDLSNLDNYDVVSSTLVMDANITAQPGEINHVGKKSNDYFTLTVSYESGNIGAASGSGSGTWLPTSFYSHDAGTLELIAITAIATETVGNNPPVYNTKIFSKELRLRGLGELNQDQVVFIFLFKRIVIINDLMYPGYAASSGSTNYKGGADMVGVPTAIFLTEFSSVAHDPEPVFFASVGFLLSGATAMVFIRQKRRQFT